MTPHLDGGPLLALAALRRDLVDARGAAGARVRLLQPLVEQRLGACTCFLKSAAGLEAADGSLREQCCRTGCPRRGPTSQPA